MIESRLLTHHEFAPWADALIMRMERPPTWLIDLTVTPYFMKAAGFPKAFALSEPCVDGLTWEMSAEDYVASQYLRFQRREISWATFLLEAGRQTDANGGRNPCEYFYNFLTAYEDVGFTESLELEQRRIISTDYADVIASVRETFQDIAKYRAS
jgi:hypothetical protein